MVLADLLFPRICPVCGEILNRRERGLCLGCYCDLPLTFFWNWRDNPAEQLFWGRLYTEACASLIFYREDCPYKAIIHDFKYNSRRDLGDYLSSLLAQKLITSGRFSEIDLIVPVPLHWYKRWKRGFNQSQIIANSLSRILGIPVANNVLKRKRFTSTQTRKTHDQRWRNVCGAFELKNIESIAGKHILLVDDVLTTGATLDACGNIILALDGCKVSIATLALVE